MFNYINGYLLFPFLEKYTKRQITVKLNELRRFDRLAPAEQETLQRHYCYSMLMFCKANIPYYRDLFETAQFDIEKVRSDIRYLSDLPILTKNIIREQSGRLKLETAHHVRKTGGSTGQSVHFFYDNEGLDWTSAINIFALEMTGKRPYHRDCHISSELGLAPTLMRDRFLDGIKLFSQNRERLMISSFSNNDLDDLYDQLCRMKPFLLQGHPSTAYAIGLRALESGRDLKFRLSIFEPTGEMLTEKQVAVIEKAFHCKVVNRYGNAECGVIAHSKLADSFRRLQIFRRAFHLEPVDKGPLIVTNFTNFGFPLIRYDTGDIGSVDINSSGAYLRDIQGRVHDIVIIDSKEYPTHFIMDYLDHKVRGIREFQIHILEKAHPILNIVLESDSDRERVESLVLTYWPKGLKVEFKKFEDLETVGWRNKFRHVIDKRRPQNAQLTSDFV